jgi:hypothetical protein
MLYLRLPLGLCTEGGDTKGTEGATITIGFLFLPVNIIPNIYHLAKKLI